MQLTIINGSPRGKNGNTKILLEKVVEGFLEKLQADVQLVFLNNPQERAIAHQQFSNSDLILLGFPLYTDAMPGLVKEFIESLAPYVGQQKNPKLGFLVQSGFPEAHHSRFVERYLEKLAHRLGAPYAGTIVKGGCEGVRMMPDQMNRKLFEGLHMLGTDLALEGRFDPEKLKSLAKPESYSPIYAQILKLVYKIPFTQFYWNSQLKQNDVYEDRFAKPFID